MGAQTGPSPRATTGPPGPRRTGWRYTFSSLAIRDYRYFYLGIVVVTGGSHAMGIARNYLVWELTGSAKLVGVVTAGLTVPALGLALFGGVLADRFDRKLIVQTYNLTKAGIALFVALSMTFKQITWVHLLIAAVVQGAAWSFYSPARNSMIPRLVGRDRLSNAMALQGAQVSAMSLAGPALAGVLYTVIGPESLHYLIAITGLAGFWFTSKVPRLAPENTGERPAVLSDIREGLVYIKNDPMLITFLAMAVATIMLAHPFTQLLPVFVSEVYGQEAGAYGLMIGLTGLGSLIGALMIAAVGPRRRGLLLVTGGVLTGLAVILTSAFPVYLVGLGFMVVFGFGEAARRTLNQALILEHTDDRFRGRVISLYTLSAGIIPIGVLPAGIAMDVWRSQPTVAGLGVLMVAFFLLVLVTQRRVRELR